MSAEGRFRLELAVRLSALFGGVVLAGIGVRFLIAPDLAAREFGIAVGSPGVALHQAIAYRDIWLGLLAAALACLGEWRALAIWLGLGALACFADSAIAVTSSGRTGAVAFHIGAGLVFAVLGLAAWRLHRGVGSR